MASSSSIDLSLLPPPDVLEVLDYESILASIEVDFTTRYPDHAGFLESDPAKKLLELVAYLSLMLRQRVNDAARECMLAYATGTNLDHLGGLLGVSRLLIEQADPEAIPPIEAVLETDGDFRNRIQESLEGFSVAGPAGAYRAHARAIADVKDVHVSSPTPGEVLVSVLSRDGEGTPPQSLLDAVAAALNDEDVRPLTDNVTVSAPTIKNYSVTATITTLAGPDSSTVLAAAKKAVEAYVTKQHRIAADITFSGLYAALHQGGVHRVELTEPAAEIINGAHEAAYCSGITINHGGIDE